MRAAVLALAIFGVLGISCSRPSIGLSVGGTNVPPSREGSYCSSGGCSGVCADGPAPVAPVTRVRAALPVSLRFDVPPEVTELHASLWRGETISGPAIESFTLAHGERGYTASSIAQCRYYLIVSVLWSRPFDRGDTSYAFALDVSAQ